MTISATVLLVALIVLWAMSGCGATGVEAVVPDEIQVGVSHGWGMNEGGRGGDGDTTRNAVWIAPTYKLDRYKHPAPFDHAARQELMAAHEALEDAIEESVNGSPEHPKPPWWETTEGTVGIITAIGGLLALLGLGGKRAYDAYTKPDSP
jgi:hypothetical protein